MEDLPFLATTARSLLLLPLLSGCAYKNEDCSDDEKSFFDDVVGWVASNKSAIQDNMDALFPAAKRDGDDIVKRLNNADVKCTVFTKDPYRLGDSIPGLSIIHVNVEYPAILDAPSFEQVVEDYVDSGWIIDDMNPDYAQVYTGLLAHEAAHLAGLDHAADSDEKNQAINDEDLPTEEDLIEESQIDEVIAWGSSTSLVTLGVEL